MSQKLTITELPTFDMADQDTLDGHLAMEAEKGGFASPEEIQEFLDSLDEITPPAATLNLSQFRLK